MRIGYNTNIGLQRRQNEDSVYVNKSDPLFAIVADGMGGHNAGEVASKMSVDVLCDVILDNEKNDIDYEDKIRDAFVLANSKIYCFAEDNSKLLGMGCTTVMALIHDNMLYVGNVGDSRAYVIDDDIKQISIDHSYVQHLIDKGEITEEQARKHPKRNYITRAMGTERTVAVDVFKRVYNGEIILLCSDGLSNLVETSEIKKIVDSYDNLQDSADKLIELANERGGSDNITVAIIEDKRGNENE